MVERVGKNASGCEFVGGRLEDRLGSGRGYRSPPVRPPIPLSLESAVLRSAGALSRVAGRGLGVGDVVRLGRTTLTVRPHL